MAKILCVLHDDPIGGYPESDARDGIPKIDRCPWRSIGGDARTMPHHGMTPHTTWTSLSAQTHRAARAGEILEC